MIPLLWVFLAILASPFKHSIIFAAMKHVSEMVHDMAPGRNILAPDKTEMKRDLDTLENYRDTFRARRRNTEEEREALEGSRAADVA